MIVLQPIKKPNKFTNKPGSSLVRCGQMSIKVTWFRPILMKKEDNSELTQLINL